MNTISHSETSLLGKVCMHQENNALFMIKNVNFAFFLRTLLGHSKNNTDKYTWLIICMTIPLFPYT